MGARPLSWVDSEAAVESMFSRMKLIITNRRTTTAQAHLEMLLYIHINGPGGSADSAYPEHLRISKEEVISWAVKLFIRRARRLQSLKRRKRGGTASSEMDELEDAMDFRWGTGTEHYQERVDAMAKAVERAEDRERRIEEARGIIDQDKRDALAEKEKERLAELLSSEAMLTLEKIQTAISGDVVFAKVLGSGKAIEVRECVPDLDSSELFRGEHCNSKLQNCNCKTLTHH
jgi:hypothetical protein